MGNEIQKEKTIAVAYATDENYLFYTSVSIVSLLENASKDIIYKVYVFVGDEFVDEEHILDSLQKQYSNLEIKVCRIDSKKVGEVYINNQHLTKAAYYRLLMTDYVEEEKCIYLDSDTLVMGDIEALWNVEMDEYYLAGCRDIWIDWMTEEEKELRRKRSNMPSLEQYINSGVLIFNLDKIRKDGMDKRFLQEMQNKYPYEDQDILNFCCYNCIKRLPEKWNQFTEVYFSSESMQKTDSLKKLERQFYLTDGIVHYTNKQAAPWKEMTFWRNDCWWEMASRLSYVKKYQQLRQCAEKKDNSQNWKSILKKCSKYKKIVIWGYTIYGREVCDWLLTSGINVDIVFCDGNIEKQGEVYKDIEVISPVQALEYKSECLYLIVSQNHGEQIEENLRNEQVLNSNIFLYRKKRKEYYRYLSNRYYMEEIEEISIKEGIEKDLMQDMEYLRFREDLCEKYYLFDWILKERKIF